MPESEEKKIIKPVNKFLRVITIAKRARQLSEGARPLVEGHSNDPIETAMREVEASKIQVEMKKPKEFKLVKETILAEIFQEKPSKVRSTKVTKSKKAKKGKK